MQTGRRLGSEPPEHEADQCGAEEAEGDTCGGSDQALQAELRNPNLENDRETGDQPAHQSGVPPRLSRGPEISGRETENQYEYNTNQNKVQHCTPLRSA